MSRLMRAVFVWPGENRGLLIALWFHVGLAVAALVALPFDHRLILGISPWIKPLKFDISVFIYLATIAILLHLLRDRWLRIRGWIGWGVGMALMGEDTVISVQSLRGVPSHMNYTSAFNGMAFGLMGVFILVNTVLVAILFGVYWRRVPLPVSLVWGIRLGLGAFLVGSLEGVLMVAHGGHTVGADDGLPGLPFVNWVHGHGDLRIAHFFALHCLQVFPVAGWALSRSRLGVGMQLAALGAGFAGYMAFVWWLFVRALAGVSLF